MVRIEYSKCPECSRSLIQCQLSPSHCIRSLLSINTCLVRWNVNICPSSSHIIKIAANLEPPRMDGATSQLLQPVSSQKPGE